MESITTSSGIGIHTQHWKRMRKNVIQHFPEEACGLVAGQDGKSIDLFHIPNVLLSIVKFRMDPREQVQHLLMFESRGWDLLAIYHSHPYGPSYPSQTDIAEAAYPETIYLIWSPTSGVWTCRGFLIQDQSIEEVPILIL